MPSRFTFRLVPRSLVGRVFALYALALVVFMVSVLALFYRYQFSAELGDELTRADSLSAVLRPVVSDSAVIGDYDTIRKVLERAVYQSSFASATFIDLRGGAVKVPGDSRADVQPPGWLLKYVESRLYDNNSPIVVGGRDYGVLRLSFASERIAGRIWQQTRFALAVGVIGLILGVVLIRIPLVKWLGNLSRIQAFEEAMRSGRAVPEMLLAEEAPIEFRETFAVLGRAAASLQAQREQAAVTLGAIADGVFTLDAVGRVALANPAACYMTGRTLDSILGADIRELLPAVYQGQAQSQSWSGRRAVLSAGTPHEVVVDTTLSQIVDASGRPVGFVLACRDVTEQNALDQRLRAELQARAAALVSLRSVLEGLTGTSSASSVKVAGIDDLQAITSMISDLVTRLQVRGEQLDAIFALSPDGFVSFDSQGRANYVSPAFSTLTGWAASRVLGSDEREVEALLRAQCASTGAWRGFDAIRRDRRLSEEGATPRRDLIEMVKPIRRVIEVGLRESSTQAISQVLYLRDVTHESEVDQMKSEFLSTAAHELRTPMTSIYGFTELMLHRNLSPEQQKKVLSTVHRQTQLMIAIVNELLDLARIEARRGKDFALETLDLVEIVANVVNDFKPGEPRDPPVVSSFPGSAWVRIDRNKMSQAIGNVLSNAFKYSAAGTPVRVSLVRSPDASERMVGVQIEDQGIGIGPAQLARVTERFYRVDDSGSIPGTGLGMSIVKEIIELLGGRLALASTLGVGTTVTLWLPEEPETSGRAVAPLSS